MQSKLVFEEAGERTFVLVLAAGEEAFAAISDFAARESLSAASLTAIGAFERATLGWFDLANKTYKPIHIESQCEGLSLLGDIAVADDGKPSLHMHAVMGLSDGTTRGGHFLKGVVPQWELVDIYKGMLQFMALQLAVLVLIIAFPQIALWLPAQIYGK